MPRLWRGIFFSFGLSAGMGETEHAAEPRLTGRQEEIFAVRGAPEFAVFDGILAQAVASPGLFWVDDAGVSLGEGAFGDAEALAFYVRWGLEAAWLMRAGVGPAVARLAAARAAAQFAVAEWDGVAALPGWVAAFAGDLAPGEAVLREAAPEGDRADFAAVRAAWAELGTAEALMETGGDIRLQRDPVTALNGYGCSHRPRPWAVTFASSTASSSSERGYAAADFLRLQVTARLFAGGEA